MWKLAKSLIVIVPAFLAGFLAWLFLPCQPERSVLMPAGTKLLEFSPAGRYVVTIQSHEARLMLWRTDTGQPAYEVEIPCRTPPDFSNGPRAFYGFSADDRWLAITTGSLEEPLLVIVDLTTHNTLTVDALPGIPGRYRPRPAFSSDGRYLSYFSEVAFGQDCAIVYDIAGKQECLRVPGVSDSLGPPTPQGKWLLKRANEIEVWDVAQRRQEGVLPPWPQGWSAICTSLTPDEQAVTALCFVFSPFPQEHIVLYRCDLTTQKIEKDWEYELPSSAIPLWNIASSEPIQLLLIQTRDESGKLVQHLLDVTTGRLLARYSEAIDMQQVFIGFPDQPRDHTLPWSPCLGRSGAMAIDSERRVLVSKWVSRDNQSWYYFGDFLRWLGVKPGLPPVHVQFHSVQTGELLERISLQTPYYLDPRDPTLALHPSQPLLAVIDDDRSNARLQFWRVPPPKPWDLIVACGFAAAACASLAWIAISRARKRKSELTDHCSS